MTEHVAQRPSWDCDTCGKPWPCDPARERLAAEYADNMTGLASLLWSYLDDYSLECGPGPFGEAYERFIAWSDPLVEASRPAEQKRDEAAKAQLAWNNRRILAERCRWPAGALETCERIDRQRPGWWSGWLPENTIPGFQRPAGYMSWRSRSDNAPVFATDVESLLEAIDFEPPPHRMRFERAAGEPCLCRRCTA